MISDKEFLKEQFFNLAHEGVVFDIPTWADNYRIIASGPFPGQWSTERTPYLKEIMEEMSPQSFTQEVVFLKSAQVGATSVLENILLYYIDHCPSDQLFISATESLLNKWSSRRLEPSISLMGLRDKIHTQELNDKSRRSGDKVFSKQYQGRQLDLASAQAASGLRSMDKRILLMDEIDGAPENLRSGEGNFLDVAFARTNAWGARRKVMYASTPTTFEKSQIYRKFEDGDRRNFLVPCPKCGLFQALEWNETSKPFGLKPIKNKDQMTVDVVYVCKGCSYEIKNYEKRDIFPKGKWHPTAKASVPYLKSYYLPSLYSPLGMMSWLELWQRYEKAKSKSSAEAMRSFVNLYLGLPYKEAGSKPKIENVISLRGDYPRGTVPEGVIFMTVGIDVQRGSETDKLNPARIEMEFLGHGINYRTYSIDYKVFKGPVADPHSGAWAKFTEWAKETGMTFKKASGQKLSPQLILIDSGDGMYTSTVYQFCEGWRNAYPSKGFSLLKNKKHDGLDVLDRSSFRRYRLAKLNDTLLYEISTIYYKTSLYHNLKIERQPGPNQRAGFCDFPRDYQKSYFEMLTAEDKRTDGSFFLPSGRRNEGLDCFDPETEVLTNEGWKKFNQLNQMETIATVNLEKNLIEFQKASEWIEKDYDGPMIQLKGNGIDI
jgi:phage terminase large subunit GpA-like protein